MRLISYIFLCLATMSACCKNEAIIPAVNAQDREFTVKSSVDNFTTMQLSNLAIQKSASAPVAAFAQSLKSQHENAREVLHYIAADLALLIVDSFDIKAMPLRAELSLANGRAFDSIYIHNQRSLLEIRKALLSAILDSGKNNRIKSYAGELLQNTNANLLLADSLVLAYQ
jgi:predicted outer membrane protein